jgi:hypothetical protein
VQCAARVRCDGNQAAEGRDFEGGLSELVQHYEGVAWIGQAITEYDEVLGRIRKGVPRRCAHDERDKYKTDQPVQIVCHGISPWVIWNGTATATKFVDEVPCTPTHVNERKTES